MSTLICNGCNQDVPAHHDVPHTQECVWHSKHPEWKPCTHDGGCFREAS